jgi:hypothetical protein
MAKTMVEVAFGVNDWVDILAISTKGQVDQVTVEPGRQLYRVVYWLEGKRQEVWMYQHEIQDAPPPKKGVSHAMHAV